LRFPAICLASALPVSLQSRTSRKCQCRKRALQSRCVTPLPHLVLKHDSPQISRLHFGRCVVFFVTQTDVHNLFSTVLSSLHHRHPLFLDLPPSRPRSSFFARSSAFFSSTFFLLSCPKLCDREDLAPSESLKVRGRSSSTFRSRRFHSRSVSFFPSTLRDSQTLMISATVSVFDFSPPC